MLPFLRFLLGLRLTFAEHRYIELFYRGSQSSNGGRGYNRTSVRGGGRQPRRKCDEDFAAAAERSALRVYLLFTALLERRLRITKQLNIHNFLCFFNIFLSGPKHPAPARALFKASFFG